MDEIQADSRGSGTSAGWVGNVIAYYDLSKEIRESRLLQLYEYLKTHTYLQARARFRCSGDFCSKAKRFGSRVTMPIPKPKPKDEQPTREERIRAIKESLQRIQELKRRKA